MLLFWLMLSRSGGVWLIKIMISREEGANSASAGRVGGDVIWEGKAGGRLGLKCYKKG